MRNEVEIELQYFIEATVYLWIAEWLTNKGEADDMTRLLCEDEDETGSRMVLYNLLMDFCEFLDMQIDRNTLVNSISKEWGIETTPKRDDDRRSVGCLEFPCLENGVNKGMEGDIAGMPLDFWFSADYPYGILVTVDE